MCKAWWNPDLSVVISRQFNTHRLAKTGGGFSNIHRHIKHRAAHHAHQFALGLPDLIMQTAQHAPGAAAMVVLHKIDIKAGSFVEGFLVEAFEEEAARIAEHLGLDDEYVWDGGGDYVHDAIRMHWIPGQARDDRRLSIY